jgi:hypothetical protein
MNLRIQPRESEGLDSIRSGTVRVVMQRDGVDAFPRRRFDALNCVQHDDRNPYHGVGSAATC